MQTSDGGTLRAFRALSFLRKVGGPVSALHKRRQGSAPTRAAHQHLGATKERSMRRELALGAIFLLSACGSNTPTTTFGEPSSSGGGSGASSGASGSGGSSASGGSGSGGNA